MLVLDDIGEFLELPVIEAAKNDVYTWAHQITLSLEEQYSHLIQRLKDPLLKGEMGVGELTNGGTPAWAPSPHTESLLFVMTQGTEAVPTTVPGPIAAFTKIYTLPEFAPCAHGADPGCSAVVRIDAFAPSNANAQQVTGLYVQAESKGGSGNNDVAGIVCYARSANGQGSAYLGVERIETAAALSGSTCEFNVTNVSGVSGPVNDSGGGGSQVLRLSSWATNDGGVTHYKNGAAILLRSFGADDSKEQAFYYGLFATNNAIETSLIEDASHADHIMRARGQSYLETINLVGASAANAGIYLRADDNRAGDILWNDGMVIQGYGNKFLPGADNAGQLGANTTRWNAAWIREVVSDQVDFVSVLLAGLGTPVNGVVRFCSDCNAASNPCTGGGGGALAVRTGGAWRCL